MAVQRTYQAIVTVLDRTAAPLRAIQSRLAGLAPVGLNVAQRLRLVMDRLRDMAGQPAFQRVTASATRLGEAVRGVVSRVASLNLALTGLLGAGGGVAGFMMLGRASMDTAGRLADLQGQTGLTAREILGLEYVFSMAGGSAEEATGAIAKLSRGIAEAASGKNKNLAGLFSRLGINLRDARGQLRGAADLMPELAAAFERNPNQAVRDRMARALFGLSSRPMIAALAQGREGFVAQMEEGWRLNPQWTDENVSAVDETEDAFAKLTKAVEGLRDAIFVRLLPALAPTIERLTEWVVANQDLIGARVSEWVLGIVAAIEGWDLSGFLERMERWGGLALSVVDALGGLQNVLIGLGAVMLAPGMVALGGLAVSLGGLLAALGAPAIAAIAAFAAAAYLIWDNWEPIRTFFEELFGRIGEWARAAWEFIRPIVDGARDLLRATEGRGQGALSNPEGQAQRRGNFGARGRIYEPLPEEGDGRGEFLRPQSAPGGAGAGELDIRVRFDDLPRGARVDVTRGGAAPAPEVDVGYAALGVP